MTAVADRPATEVQPDYRPTERYEPAIPLSQLHESPHNPRKHFDMGALQELADSLKAKGQSTPLLVRPIRRASHESQPGYEIAAGHRRFRAAKLAALPTLAAVVREMDDARFLEELVIENMGREDLTPLEECDGYAALLKLPGYDVAAIAAKVGKSESYVYRRLALQKLGKAGRKALEDGDIEVGHAEIIARFPDLELQKMLLQECTGWRAVSVAQLRRHVEAEVLLQLKGVSWKLDDATMPGGACASCPKRTGATPALFEDLARDDRCLDGACYHGKVQASVTRRRAALEAEGEPFVQVATIYSAKGEKGVLRVSDYTNCAKSTKGAERALVVDGPNAGSMTWIKRWERDTPTASTSTYQADQKKREAKARIQSAARLEALGQLLDKVPAKLGRRELDVVAAGILHRALHDAKRLMCKRQGWEVKKSRNGFSLDHDTPIKAALAAADDGTLVRLCLELLLIDATQVGTYGSGSPAAHFQAALKAYRVELAPIVARHTKAANEKQREKQARAKKAKKGAAKKRAGDVARARKRKAARQ